MKSIGIFTLLAIVTVCSADLANIPSSTPTPGSLTRTPAGEPSKLGQQTLTPSGRTSSLFLPTSAEQTSTSVGGTSILNEQSSTSVEPSTSHGQPSSSVGPTSTSVGQTSTLNKQRPTSSARPRPAPVRCGPVPRNIHHCIGGPRLVKPEWGHACSSKYTDECEVMTCVYEHAGWIENGEIAKLKVAIHFTEVAKNQRQWTDAVNQALELCIWEKLPPQGVYLKCPAYDVTSCVEAAFVRNTIPSQWSNSSDCQQTKLMASACPFCPEDCFAPVVPYGSCQACLGLGRQTPSPSINV